jgi:hypothetical protein
MSVKVVKIQKVIASVAIVLLFSLGFFLLGMFIDIMIILKYDMTPFSFTFLLPFCGGILGFGLAWKIIYNKV